MTAIFVGRGGHDASSSIIPTSGIFYGLGFLHLLTAIRVQDLHYTQYFCIQYWFWQLTAFPSQTHHPQPLHSLVSTTSVSLAVYMLLPAGIIIVLADVYGEDHTVQKVV